MSFYIVCINPPEPPVPILDASDNKPILFPDGPTARARCDSLMDHDANYGWRDDREPNRVSYKPRKFQPRKFVPEGDWRKREQSRFDDGTYRPVVWANEPWALTNETKDHFVHIAQDDDACVAYTRDALHGEADRQSRLSIGSYLERYYRHKHYRYNGQYKLNPEYVQNFIPNWVHKHELHILGPCEILFATTADEMVRVYTKGPQSCMSHPEVTWPSGIHPVRAYAAGDFAVAYLERNGKITARAVCVPERKVWWSYYGDTRLATAFEAQGWTRNADAFFGCKFARIPAPKINSRVYVMLYCDFGGYTILQDDHFVLVSSTEMDDGKYDKERIEGRVAGAGSSAGYIELGRDFESITYGGELDEEHGPVNDDEIDDDEPCQCDDCRARRELILEETR